MRIQAFAASLTLEQQGKRELMVTPEDQQVPAAYIKLVEQVQYVKAGTSRVCFHVYVWLICTHALDILTLTLTLTRTHTHIYIYTYTHSLTHTHTLAEDIALRSTWQQAKHDYYHYAKNKKISHQRRRIRRYGL
jgi:hypothetical protein